MSLETGNTGTQEGGARARRFRYSEKPVAATAVAELAVVPAPELLPPAIEWNGVWIALGIAAAALVFLYPTALSQLVDRWASDAGWSHGFVVPFIAAFFVRLKWDTLRLLVPKGTWVGLAVVLVGVVGQVLFRATGVTNMSTLSILVILYGTVLLVFGWEYMKILWLPITYLAFALPPPESLYVMLTMKMQAIAASTGLQLLPLFGCDGTRHGVVLDVSYNGFHKELEVAQACAGMRMLVAFFALAVALAYSQDRPVWQKITLTLFAFPVAIICNALRVALTGVMAVRVDPAWAEGKAHEYFGLLMLGPALVMQLGFAWLLDKIFIDRVDADDRGAA